VTCHGALTWQSLAARRAWSYPRKLVTAWGIEAAYRGGVSKPHFSTEGVIRLQQAVMQVLQRQWNRRSPNTEMPVAHQALAAYILASILRCRFAAHLLGRAVPSYVNVISFGPPM